MHVVKNEIIIIPQVIVLWRLKIFSCSIDTLKLFDSLQDCSNLSIKFDFKEEVLA